MLPIAYLPDRGVIEVSGEDRVAFLQGLVSNDVTRVGPGEAVWAALLTPQGKWVADFFIMAQGDALWLECERAQAADIVQRLRRFRLRARVEIEDVSERHFVHALWGPIGVTSPFAVADPRLEAAGKRAALPERIAAPETAAAYDRHRLMLGLPDGSKDLDADKTVLLEAGFDELNGISWTKGCYMGQELTARTRYRGLVKRRLVPVGIEGPVPARDTPVTADGADVGAMRSGVEGIGLALLRLDVLDGRHLACGEAVLTPRIPRWMRLPGRDGTPA